MESCAEAGWDFDDSGVVSPGAAKGTIQSRLRIHIPRRTNLWFVSRPELSAYGSTSMDCRYALRPWANRMAGLYDHPSAAHDASGGRAFFFARF